MAKADKRLGWGFFWLTTGVGTVIGLILGAPIESSWVLNVLVGICLFSFIASAYYFGWFNAPPSAGKIGVAPRVVLIVSMICLGLAILRSKVGGAPKVEISKVITIASINIAPGGEAEIRTLEDGFKIGGGLCENSENKPLDWVKQKKGTAPELMFAYHVSNHNRYSITNVKADFKVRFFVDSESVISGRNSFDIYIKDIAPFQEYTFYVLNQSHYEAMIDSPTTVDLQIPGDDPSTIPITHGEVLFVRFPISDIKPEAGQLDLPLDATRRDWSKAGCSND